MVGRRIGVDIHNRLGELRRRTHREVRPLHARGRRPSEYEGAPGRPKPRPEIGRSAHCSTSPLWWGPQARQAAQVLLTRSAHADFSLFNHRVNPTANAPKPAAGDDKVRNRSEKDSRIPSHKAPADLAVAAVWPGLDQRGDPGERCRVVPCGRVARGAVLNYLYADGRGASSAGRPLIPGETRASRSHESGPAGGGNRPCFPWAVFSEGCL